MISFDQHDAQRIRSSIVYSLIFWIAIGFLLVVIPLRTPQPQSVQYKDILLSLNTQTNLEEKITKKEIEPIQEPVINEVIASALVPAKVESKEKSQSPSQISPQKPAVSQATQNNAIPKPAGLGIPNFSSPVESSSSSLNTPEHLDFSSTEQHTKHITAQSEKSKSPVAEFEGSAGIITKDTNQGSAIAMSNRIEQQVTSSDSTKQALSSISTAKIQGSLYEDANSLDPSNATEHRGGATQGSRDTHGLSKSFTFEGPSRKIVYPENPSIVLPDHIARLVDTSTTVQIQFTVLADGSVPIGLIQFIPDSLLTAPVKDYLRREFSSWRFEKYTEDGQARFEYSIKTQ